MTKYAFICTRSEVVGATTTNLVRYLSRANVEIKLLINQNSIFEGYAKAFQKVDPRPDDIIIMCHDDIEIANDVEAFNTILEQVLDDNNIGFIGPAGTTRLEEDAVWWDHSRWQKGFHRGFVYHGSDLYLAQPTLYGQYGPVVALDGLFLAARASTLRKLELTKPSYLSGNWDFYDIHYTISSYLAGYTNLAVPIIVLHNSKGEIVGKESWIKNREAFIAKHKDKFPFTVQSYGRAN